MASCLNLMSEAAMNRSAADRIVRGWLIVVGLCLLVIMPLTTWTWLCRREVVREHEALEARYEPIRRLNATNRDLSQTAADLVRTERVPLELSRRRPVAALLNVIGEAIASTAGEAFIAHISLSRDPTAKTDAVDPGGVLVIEVVTTEGYDIAELARELQRPPVKSVKVLSSEAAIVANVKSNKHSIECLY
jgi:hypothetical protein